MWFGATLFSLIHQRYQQFHRFICHFINLLSDSAGWDDGLKYIQELLAYKIEGMIILSHTISSKELASYGIPGGYILLDNGIDVY